MNTHFSEELEEFIKNSSQKHFMELGGSKVIYNGDENQNTDKDFVLHQFKVVSNVLIVSVYVNNVRDTTQAFDFLDNFHENILSDIAKEYPTYSEYVHTQKLGAGQRTAELRIMDFLTK